MTTDRADTSAPDASAPGAPRYALAWAALVCAIAALTLAHPALTGGFLVNPRSDQYMAGFAFRDFAAQALQTTGGFPQWNPYLQGGMPYIDAMHGDIFYPTFLLRMIFPTDIAMTWGMILHLWLAGVATYAFLRAQRLSFAASLIGGIAYMMSGMVAGLVSPGHDGKLFISALFPLTLLVLRWGIRDGRAWAWGALALVVGLAILTPHPQLLQYLLLGGGAYALWLAFGEGGEGAPARRVAVQRLVLAVVAVAIGMSIGAVQFLPLRDYTAWSPRAGGAGWEHAISYSMPPEEWISTIIPQFSGILDRYWGRNPIHLHSEYIGLPVFLLAAGAFGGAARTHRRAAWFWTGLLVVTGLWAMGGFTPFYKLVYAIVPGTKYFRAPSTIMFECAFALAVLASFGAERLLREGFSKRFLTGAAIAAGVVTLLGVSGMLNGMAASFVADGRFEQFNANRGAVQGGAWRAGIFAALLLAAMYAVSHRKLVGTLAGGAIALVLAGDLWSIDRIYWLFSPRATAIFGSDAIVERIKSDSVPGRVFAFQLGPDAAYHDPFFSGDAMMVQQVRNVTGYHGNEFMRYRVLVEQGLYARANTAAQLLDALAAPSFRQLTNLRWFYTNIADVPAPFEKVLGPVRNSVGTNVWLYKVPGDNPPAWIVPAIMKAPDEPTLATLLSADVVRNVALFDTAAAVQSEILTEAPVALAIRARATRFEPGAIDIELDAPAPAKSALIVSENYYPGWTVTVDGKPALAARADYTLIGVPLTAGARKIELRFSSSGYAAGKRVTMIAVLLALVLAAGGVVIDRRRTRA